MEVFWAFEEVVCCMEFVLGVGANVNNRNRWRSSSIPTINPTSFNPPFALLFLLFSFNPRPPSSLLVILSLRNIASLDIHNRRTDSAIIEEYLNLWVEDPCPHPGGAEPLGFFGG
jgi:hypothetical protein